MSRGLFGKHLAQESGLGVGFGYRQEIPSRGGGVQGYGHESCYVTIGLMIPDVRPTVARAVLSSLGRYQHIWPAHGIFGIGGYSSNIVYFEAAEHYCLYLLIRNC
jgi:hypothetical protein